MADARRALLLILGLLLPWPASAQDARWYRVELMVFAQPGGGGAEIWEPLPDLAYPGAARFLLRPDEIRNNSARYGVPVELDEFGRQYFELPTAHSATGTAATGDAGQPAAVDDAGADAAAAGSSDAAARPTPFLILPGAQLEFRGKAAYMERNGGYRILFHETWAQPVGAESRALPIVLDRSGDLQQWPELQGSVRFYLSRYLHLETNLWLNTRGDYLPGDWRMPPPPLGPRAVIVTEPEPPEPLQPPASPGADDGADSGQATAATAGITAWSVDPATGELVPETEPEAEPAVEAEQGPEYPWRHAVLLQQKRRMRSNEVHYLDHPMLGVIAVLTPLTEEDLAALAAAEPDYNPAINSASN